MLAWAGSLVAKGKMGYTIWDWWGSWARGVGEARDPHEDFMLHMRYHGPRMLPQPAGDVAALVCS